MTKSVHEVDGPTSKNYPPVHLITIIPKCWSDDRRPQGHPQTIYYTLIRAPYRFLVDAEDLYGVCAFDDPNNRTLSGRYEANEDEANVFFNLS